MEATGWSAGSGTSRRRRTGAGDLGGREVEDDGDDVAMACPGPLGSVEMTKMTSWSPWSSLGGEGEAVAAATASSGVGCARVRAREGDRGEEKHGGE